MSGARKGKDMSAQSVSIGSMFGWIVDAFKLLGRNFLSLMSASGVTLALVVLMFLPMWIFMFASMMQAMKGGGVPSGSMPMAGNIALFYSMYGISIILSLLLFPPMLVGWFRLFQDIDQGNAVRGLDILKPYKDKPVWFRSLRFALLAFLIYVAVFALFGLAFSGPISDFMQQVAAQHAATIAGATPAPPHFPAALVLAYFGFLGVAILMQFVYMLGFAEVSLRTTSAVEAMKQAAGGVFKNALKLILFLICAFLLSAVALFIVVLLLGLLVGILTLVHPVLAMVAAIILYIPILLCMYPLMFGGHYFVWKSILGGGNRALPNVNDATLSV